MSQYAVFYLVLQQNCKCQRPVAITTFNFYLVSLFKGLITGKVYNIYLYYPPYILMLLIFFLLLLSSLLLLAPP